MCHKACELSPSIICCPHFQVFFALPLLSLSLIHFFTTIQRSPSPPITADTGRRCTTWPRIITYCKELLPANSRDDLQHSGNSTSLRHNVERVQQKISSGRSSQSQPLKLADAEQPFCALTEECITPKGQPNQAALWTPNKNSFNEDFVSGQTMGRAIVCLKLCILLGRSMELFWSLNLSEDPIVF